MNEIRILRLLAIGSILIIPASCNGSLEIRDKKTGSIDEAHTENRKQESNINRPTLDAPPVPPTPEQIAELLAATDENTFSGKYDDAEWHYGGQFPEDVPESYGFTHIGFFLAWATERDLLSEFMHQESGDVVASTLRREAEPIRLIGVWDGKLVDDMLNDEANGFAQQYYSMEIREKTYNDDYAHVFGDENIYHVEPSWDNYDKLKPMLDSRFNEWRAAVGEEKE